MRAFAFALLPALFLARCASEPRYAEPARCIENDCSDQRPGWDAGVRSVHDAAVSGDADYATEM